MQVTLSKPATETFTIDYSFNGGDAVKNSDYWWWSDDTGYRQITFVKGQSTAVINVDVRNDSEVESTETFNIDFKIAGGSENKYILGAEQVTVTIEDDDSSSGALDLNTLTDLVMTKLKSTLATELKTLTDANSADLSSTNTSFTDILLSNEAISDISTYLTGEVTEDITLYDGVLKEVIGLANEYVNAARGPSNIETSVKLDGQQMAKDFTAINIGFDTVDFSAFTATASDALKAAIIDAIYSSSGFKYTGATTVVSNVLSYTRTIDADAAAYANILFPADIRPGYLQNDVTFSKGTSGDDTINFSTNNANVVYQGLAGNDTIELSSQANHTIYGGLGDDLIKETTSDGYSDYYFGGPGNDKLAIYYAEQSKMIGGTGEDVFILDYVTNGARKFDANLYNSNDDDQDGTIEWNEINNAPLIIVDFEQGVDKIGLRDGAGDWDGKTIVAVQGTGTLANHTLLFMGKSERGEDSDGYVWSIVMNTTASDMTDADFVLVDANYATSTLSGVTISNDSSLASDATLILSEDSSLEQDAENTDNAFLESGLIDQSTGFSFDNVNSPDPVFQVNDYDDLFSDNSLSSQDNQLEYSVIDEIEEEEILISIDIV